MNVEPRFDPAEGELRLPAVAVELLGRLGRGTDRAVLWERAPEALALLERLGVVDGGDVHPTALPMADTIGAPLVRSVLRAGAPGPTLEARGWIAAGVAVVATPVGDDLYDLAVGHPSAVPIVIAGIVDLGPRPVPATDGAVVLPERAVRALVDPRGHGDLQPDEVLEAAQVPQDRRGALRRLAEDCRASWSAEARWMVGVDRVARARVRVLDGGPAGLWRYERRRAEGRDIARLEPTTAREVWRELCALLPSEGELLAGAPGAH